MFQLQKANLMGLSEMKTTPFKIQWDSETQETLQTFALHAVHLNEGLSLEIHGQAESVGVRVTLCYWLSLFWLIEGGPVHMP